MRPVSLPRFAYVLGSFSLLLKCAGCVEIEEISLILSARWKTEHGARASP